jgi:hypothetical protein
MLRDKVPTCETCNNYLPFKSSILEAKGFGKCRLNGKKMNPELIAGCMYWSAKVPASTEENGYTDYRGYKQPTKDGKQE